ncbi:MAG: [Clostridia bacterium]|nr:[FeFe] hydrogenase H-cluster maturation GTPase HydF [Clostridia bacterium]
MEKAPLSMRKHIGIFGKTNAGKSSLFNALLGQGVAIVSEVSGTTTDPISKPMELVGYGPVTIIDTAGFGDVSQLGPHRMEKTQEIINRCDLAILVKDISAEENSGFDFGTVPVINVYTKCDKIESKALMEKKQKHPDSIFLDGYSDVDILPLREKIKEMLLKQQRDDETLIGDILKPGDTVVLVIPIDSAAPKGRLILPQVQTIRDCIDNNITAVSVSLDMLERTLNEIKNVSLVITDSQIFKEVAEIVPESISLTSFSMLLANKKGKMMQLIEGAKAIEKLKDDDKILMLEACTHSTTHEDIGKVKIPMLMKKNTGKKLEFTHFSGYDFPEDIQRYSLVVQCGGCMINKKAIQNRLEVFEENNIPVTNYGVVLAYLNGILERASEVFIKNNI